MLKTYILNILKSNVEHKWLGKKQLKFNFIWFWKRVKGALIMLQDFIVAGKLYERRKTDALQATRLRLVTAFSFVNFDILFMFIYNVQNICICR